jgi:DNA repair protein RecO (recombination protein O)
VDRASNTDALVVRTVDFGESDRIVTLLTDTHGKIGAIARGARRSRRRFAGALQPFQVIRVVLTPRRRSELSLLGEAEVRQPFLQVTTDPARYAQANTVLEILRELTPAGEPDPRPLQFATAFLEDLENEGAHLPLLAKAILGALKLSGFVPVLDRCAACGRRAPTGRAAHFDTGRGVVCTACGGAPLKMRGTVRESLLAAARSERDLGEPELREGVELLLSCAERHIGKELKSTSLLRQLM